MPKTDLCCPDMSEGKKCDYLDFVYRLRHLSDVTSGSQNVTVPVEVSLHVRAERCTGPLKLGNLVYSTTLIPGEKVRLFSMDRRSRFSFDAESQLTYRHEKIAEEQYYMDSFESFMSDLQSRDHSQSTSTSTGSVVTSVIRRRSVRTSSMVVIPRSGIPQEPAATPPPEIYSDMRNIGCLRPSGWP